jgi:hypothetical protein
LNHRHFDLQPVRLFFPNLEGIDSAVSHTPESQPTGKRQRRPGTRQSGPRRCCREPAESRPLCTFSIPQFVPRMGGAAGLRCGAKPGRHSDCVTRAGGSRSSFPIRLPWGKGSKTSSCTNSPAPSASLVGKSIRNLLRWLACMHLFLELASCLKPACSVLRTC